MKVEELIEKLQTLDPSLEVLVTSEDADVVTPGYLVRPFEIYDVSAFNVELSRDDARRPQLAAATEGEGRKFAIIEISSNL
ncbi:hypothetical protein KJF94_07305 [Pseudomonas hormoni]|uniref:Uncharacterized protein n=1 Tax=Pseudomonas hormoni TaxID=3093767 RepID=A0ABX8F4A5_9PSED|nr:hypothetical protein [Pseudomonas hormoni]QVW25373.1 hypothetical protein KJF94_07305 [Pseudomonas hormoni]